LKKEKLSIELFGRNRFYLGLSIGFLASILVYFFFAYFREILREQSFDSDLIIPTNSEFIIYNFFFAAVAVTVGFGATVWFWFHGLFNSSKPRRRIIYISAYAMFWSMTLLYLVSKVGSNLTWILFSVDGYDDHLNLSRELPLLLFLLPIVLFLNIWTPIRLSFRSGNWLFKSLLVFVITSTILALNPPVDQTILNDSWLTYMKPYNKIVDDELKKARTKGLAFSEQAINTLRFNKKERVFEQVERLKERFKSKTPVPIDTVVLELILIKKSTIRFLNTSDWNDKEKFWPFALPRDVYQQIQVSHDSTKNAYLKEILAEYESIFNDDWENWDQISASGLHDKYFNRASMKRWLKVINSELQQLRQESISPSNIK
jgi:hypothetical protein